MMKIRTLVALSSFLILYGASHAQVESALIGRFAKPVRVEIPGPPIPVVDPATGIARDHQSFGRWSAMCGSDNTRVSDRTLRTFIARHDAQFAPGQPITVVDTPRDGPSVRASTLNVVYNLAASVPAAAVPSFAIAEQYFEGKFTDNMTLTVNVGFQSMGAGVIGATGSNFVGGVSYATSRTRLIANALPGEIQNFLPATSTLPVRFDGTTTTISNVSSVNWTVANARAAGVTNTNTLGGNMTYNLDFTFDFNPSNGVSGGSLSLVDTIIHETGHAMGFVSAADGTAAAVETMDLYRFQRTNTGGTWNPTSTATFQSLPRLVDNNTPNDDHIVDFATVEYRMSDGNPYQASHFREQSPAIGILDPALAGGQTFFPNYLRAPDIAVFKAIGWNDLPPCATTMSQQPPVSLSRIAGQSASMSATGSSSDGGAVTYQWRRGGVPLSTANTRLSGISTSTLTIDPLITSDVGSYTVLVTGCTSVTSSALTLTVAARCVADRDDGTGSGRPNGAVEIDDLLHFLLRFEQGSAEADIDNGAGFGLIDGAVNIDDLLYFLARFEAGC